MLPGSPLGLVLRGSTTALRSSLCARHRDGLSTVNGMEEAMVLTMESVSGIGKMESFNGIGKN